MRALNKYDKLEKEYRALWKEYRNLSNAKRNLGLIKLEKPIRSGWYKHLTLRDDISRRKDADILEEVLKIAGTKIWGRDRKHADKVWNKTNKRDEKIQFPGIRKIPKWDFDKLSIHAKKWFKPYDVRYKFGYGGYRRFYCIVPRFYFKIAYSKAFITHRKVIDPLIEKRLDEIEHMIFYGKYLALHNSQCKYSNYYDKEFVHRKNRRQYKSALKNYDEDKFDRLSTIKTRW